MKPLQQYRRLIKKLRVLPLDKLSFHKGKLLLKHNFTNGSQNAKKYNKTILLFDEILVYWKLTTIPSILTLIYNNELIYSKNDIGTNKFDFDLFKSFININSLSLISLWPEKHLIDECGTPEVIRLYYKNLAGETFDTSFLTRSASETISGMKFKRKDTTEKALLDFDDLPEELKLTPIVMYSEINKTSTDPIKSIITEVEKLYSFFVKNSITITGKKLSKFEVIYPPSKLGLPLPPNERRKILNKHTSMIKNLINDYKPLTKQDLDYLHKFSINKISDTLVIENGNIKSEFDKNKFLKSELDDSDSSRSDLSANTEFNAHSVDRNLNFDNPEAIDFFSTSNKSKSIFNPLFYRFMTRTQKSVSQEILKARSKRLVPNDNNIKKIYREYVRRSYYKDAASGEYRMSGLVDFWENDELKIHYFNQKIKPN